MADRYWDRQIGAAVVMVHVSANVLAPIVVMTAASWVLDKPGLLDFALYTAAPWSAVASVAIALSWLSGGRKGVFPTPPTVLRHVLPNTLVFTVLFALAALIFHALRTGEIVYVAALDGAISAFFSAVMSGLAFVGQTTSAYRKGDY